MRRRHAISPGFSGHSQDLGISSLNGMILPAIVFLAWVATATRQPHVYTYTLSCEHLLSLFGCKTCKAYMIIVFALISEPQHEYRKGVNELVGALPRLEQNCRYAEACPLRLKCLDPGSGRKVPATWHGAGACHGVCIPET